MYKALCLLAFLGLAACDDPYPEPQAEIAIAAPEGCQAAADGTVVCPLAGTARAVSSAH